MNTCVLVPGTLRCHATNALHSPECRIASYNSIVYECNAIQQLTTELLQFQCMRITHTIIKRTLVMTDTSLSQPNYIGNLWIMTSKITSWNKPANLLILKN